MALAISSNKHHTHTHTPAAHTHLQSRDARQPERGAASCQAPQPPPHRSSSFSHQPLSQPSRHHSITATNTVGGSASLWDVLPCASKRLFVRPRSLIVAGRCWSNPGLLESLRRKRHSCERPSRFCIVTGRSASARLSRSSRSARSITARTVIQGIQRTRVRLSAMSRRAARRVVSPGKLHWYPVSTLW